MRLLHQYPMRLLLIVGALLFCMAQKPDYMRDLRNQPAIPSEEFNFPAVSFSTTLAGGAEETFTFSKCPLGLKGTTLGPSIAVTGVANNGSGLIRITTAPVSLGSGQRVVISGVGGVTAANGNWAITRITKTTFDLVGSSFSGTYTSGGTIKQSIHSLYLSGGTGTAETIFVSGGTCTGLGAAGTIKAWVINSHSGTYNITSATGGAMEALWSQTGTRRRVYLSQPTLTMHGPIWLTTDFYSDISGGGIMNTVLSRASDYLADIFIIDSVAGGSALHTLHDFWIYAPYFNGRVGSAAIRLRGITCCGAYLQNIRIWDEHQGVVIDASDNIHLDKVEFSQNTIGEIQPFAGLYITGSSLDVGGAASGLFVDNSVFTVNEGYITSMPTISGAANNGSGLIRLTTSAHLFTTNNWVTVFGVGGTTEANGNWKVTVINSTTIDLQGSTFTNAYTSGGQTMFQKVLQNGMYVESADGTVISNTTLRGEFGLRINPFEVISGILFNNGVVDRVRYSSVAIGSVGSNPQGQITVSNSWLVGNYYPSYPGISIGMSAITEGRFIFSGNDIAGHYGDCVQMIHAKGVKFFGNTIGSCDLSQTGRAGIALLTTANGVSINDNTFRDIASLGSTTNWWGYFNANITNSQFVNNTMFTPQSSSMFIQAGTNSNFLTSPNVRLDAIPTTTVSANTIAIPTSVPDVLQVTGGGTATRMTGGWPSQKIKVWTVAATTFNTGGANPGDFGGAFTSDANQWVIFEMASDGKWYRQ